MNASTRPFTWTDAAAITAIFNEAVACGENTFDVTPRSPEALTAWLSLGSPYEAWIATDATRNDGVVGFGALTRYHEREAYSPTVEVSLFVRRSARRLGIGRDLARLLLARAGVRGFHSAVAITSDDASVITFAAKAGFRERGRVRSVRPLGEEWRDLVVWQAMLPVEGGGS
jgi:phosphinothricin acetyltransferase